MAKFKRFMCLFLAVVFVAALLPMGVLAAGTGTGEGTSTSNSESFSKLVNTVMSLFGSDGDTTNDTLDGLNSAVEEIKNNENLGTVAEGMTQVIEGAGGLIGGGDDAEVSLDSVTGKIVEALTGGDVSIGDTAIGGEVISGATGAIADAVKSGDIGGALTDALTGAVSSGKLEELLSGSGLIDGSVTENVGAIIKALPQNEAVQAIIGALTNKSAASETETVALMSAASSIADPETSYIADESLGYGISLTSLQSYASAGAFSSDEVNSLIAAASGGAIAFLPALVLILGAAGVDEFDEIYYALDDEIIDEIFDEANIDDPDALVSAISAALNGNFSWCDIFDKIGDCGFEFDTAKIEALIAKIKNSGCDIDVGDLIAGLVDKDFDIDAIKNILADLKIDIGSDCDISAIITELIGKGFDVDAIKNILAKLKIEIGSGCDISALIAKLAGMGFDFDTIIAKLKELGFDISIGGGCDISAIIKGFIEGGFDFKTIITKLKELGFDINIGGDCDIAAIIKGLIGGGLDISAVIEILKTYFGSSVDLDAWLAILGKLGNCDCIEKVIDFLTGLGGKFDIKAVFEWLLSLKGDTGCDWSTLIEWLKTVMGQFNFDFSTLYQWIEKFKALFGKFDFDAFIKWLISMIAGVIDPSKDPSITDPSTPLDPGVTIPNDPTALSPTTGDESSMLINLALLALALLSAGGLALLLRNKKTAAVEMVETAASTDRESTDSVASLRAFGGRRKAR